MDSYFLVAVAPIKVFLNFEAYYFYSSQSVMFFFAIYSYCIYVECVQCSTTIQALAHIVSVVSNYENKYE